MRLFDKIASQYNDPALANTTILCCDPVVDTACREWSRDSRIECHKYPYCMPPFSRSWCEANLHSVYPIEEVRQVGGLTLNASDLVARSNSLRAAVKECEAAGSARVFVSLFSVNISERIEHPPSQMIVWGVSAEGTLLKHLFRFPVSDYERLGGLYRKVACVASSLMFEAMLLSFTFLNCCNVKLEDITDDVAPPPKIRRRLKIPEVKRYTLNIAGHGARPSRDYNEGPKGVMPFHLCRGHFATYTADKPMFGNPKLVGRYWHPPHMKGKKENGEIVKDYAIQG